MNLAFVLALTLAAVDRPVIDLSGGRIQPLPLAIAKPLGSQETGTAVEAVLAQDFERSGLFRLLDPASFLAPPDERMTGIDYSKWQTVGAQALIKANCDASADVSCEMRLYDVARGQELLHGTYTAPRPALRLAAHRFGDDVVRFFTHEPGVFQTRIAWVRESESGKQVMVSDWDGFGVQPLTGASINLLPSWSPDGRMIAFTSFREGGGAHLYTVEVVSRQVRSLIGLGDFATGASYSPDGSRLLFSASQNDNTDVIFLLAAAASLSEAAADTVSSEVGQASSENARLITTFEKVPAGTDGAVSPLGTLAGIAAATIVSLICVLGGLSPWKWSGISAVAAVLGMIADSYLGASLQRRDMLNNDSVNFLSTLFSAAVAFVIASA